jgi:hypothetical protein
MTLIGRCHRREAKPDQGQSSGAGEWQRMVYAQLHLRRAPPGRPVTIDGSYRGRLSHGQARTHGQARKIREHLQSAKAAAASRTRTRSVSLVKGPAKRDHSVGALSWSWNLSMFVCFPNDFFRSCGAAVAAEPAIVALTLIRGPSYLADDAGALPI